MKTECGMIQDLLPLYVDGVCSPESKAAIEEHLQECDTCRERHQRMTAPLPEQPEPEPERVKEGRRFRKGLKKVRRRWAISLIAALLVVPLALMSVAQVTGEGVCFTNLGQIACGYHFLSLLKRGEYGKAFDMLDLEDRWTSLTDYESYNPLGAALKDYQAITIDGQTWMVSPAGLKEHFIEVPDSLEGETALDFWEDTVVDTQQDNSLYLIPVEAYETLTEEGRLPIDPSVVVDHVYDPVYVTDAAGNGYYVGTAYGVHGVDEQILSSTYCYMFPCVPETIWKVMAEEEETQRIAFEERAARYLAMGCEEWLEKSREQFIAGMEDWEAEHGRITKIRFYAAYAPTPGGDTTLHRSLGQWQLEYTLEIGGEEDGGAILRVRQGKVESINGLYWSESTVAREFWDQFRQIRYYQITDGAE